MAGHIDLPRHRTKRMERHWNPTAETLAPYRGSPFGWTWPWYIVAVVAFATSRTDSQVLILKACEGDRLQSHIPFGNLLVNPRYRFALA